MRSALLALAVLVWPDDPPWRRRPIDPPEPDQASSAPVSTPADSIFELSLFVLAVDSRHFRDRIQLAGLRGPSRFRRQKNDDGQRGRRQVYGKELTRWKLGRGTDRSPVLIVRGAVSRERPR